MLTARRKRFTKEYLIDLCPTRAAVRAGYSRRTATVQSSRLMKNPEVRAAIQVEMDERARRINVTADAVLSEISRVALHRIVVGLGKSYAPKIKMQSKRKALDQLKRHLGPYGDKVMAACFDHFVERVQASSAETPVADVERPRRAAPSPASDHCDWLPPGAPAAAPPPAPPAPVAPPPPKPYRPIMPDPQPVHWSATIEHASTEYDPNDI